MKKMPCDASDCKLLYICSFCPCCACKPSSVCSPFSLSISIWLHEIQLTRPQCKSMCPVSQTQQCNQFPEFFVFLILGRTENCNVCVYTWLESSSTWYVFNEQWVFLHSTPARETWWMSSFPFLRPVKSQTSRKNKGHNAHPFSQETKSPFFASHFFNHLASSFPPFLNLKSPLF